MEEASHCSPNGKTSGHGLCPDVLLALDVVARVNTLLDSQPSEAFCGWKNGICLPPRLKGRKGRCNCRGLCRGRSRPGGRSPVPAVKFVDDRIGLFF